MCFLITNIKDTLIYRTNINISSGGIHYINISKGKLHFEFQLHNASDPVAEKIVSILNYYIPNPDRKLWLYNFDNKKK